MQTDSRDNGKVNISPELAERLARGEITLADLIGMNKEKQYEIANVGYQLMNRGKLEEARAIYRGLVAADPFDSVFHCHLGAVHFRLGEIEAAIKEFSSALQFNHSNVDALAGRGEAFLSRGQLAEAISDLRAAVELDPQGERPATLRARALLLTLREAAQRSQQGRADDAQKS